MNHVDQDIETDDPSEQEVVAGRYRQERPWFTWFMVAVSCGIWLLLTFRADDSPASMALYGYEDAWSIWRGNLGGLFTSAFVHLAIVHLGFNMYWLWTLGGAMERAVGTLPYALFCLVTAFVSSSFQLTLSGDTGIGASGLVYGLFGFMWLTRWRYPQFHQILSVKEIQYFIGWAFLCIGLTWLNLLNIGNAAHFSGLIFGCLTAMLFEIRLRKVLMVPAYVIMLLLAVVPIYWAPWSRDWLGFAALNAHQSRKLERATQLYTDLIRRSPEEPWAYYNRGLIHSDQGAQELSKQDIAQAIALDPAYLEQAKSDGVGEFTPPPEKQE